MATTINYDDNSELTKRLVSLNKTVTKVKDPFEDSLLA